MAQFGSEVTSAPELRSFEQERSGVEGGPSIFGLASTVFDIAADVRATNRQSAAEQTVAGFTQQQLLVADAYAQGRIRTAEHARTTMRQNLINALDSNPALAKQLIAAQSSIMSLSGGANIVNDLTRAEQEIQEHRDRLISNGYVPPNATDAQVQAATTTMMTAANAERAYQQRIQAIDEEMKNINLTKERRGQLERSRVDAARTFVRDSAPAQFMDVRGQFISILNNPNLSQADKEIAIEEFMTNFEVQSGTLLSQLDADERGVYMKPFEDMKENFLKRARGEFSDAELTRANERLMAQGRNIYLSDPELLKIAAAEDIFNLSAFDTSLQQTVFNRVVDHINGNSNQPGSPAQENPFPTAPTDQEGMKEYMNLLFWNMENGSDEAKANAAQHMKNMLSSFESFEGMLRNDPESGIAVAEILGSREFLDAVQADPSIVQDVSGAAGVIQMHYADEVWSMMEKEFLSQDIITQVATAMGDGETMPADAAITAVATDSGVRFEVNPDLEGLARATAREKAAQLNRDLAPIFNTTVKALAHLEGGTNYKAITEGVLDGFGGEGSGGGGGGGGDSGDDLEIDDFIFPRVSEGGLPAEVAADQPFLSAVEELSSKYEIDPAVMLAVMDFETGGSFNPAQRNDAGSSATGLIQFMAQTARGLGTTTEELAKMDRLEQMQYVEAYFDQYADKIRGQGPEEVYMSVLFPRAIDKSDSYVLFREGTTAYRQNRGLDKNGDGTVTKAEAAARVVNLVGKHS